MKRFLLAVLFLLSGAADAAYPDKPITMIVAYSPGGGTDLIARAIAPYVEKYLGGGARIVIVHRPGAGGEIGFAALANAPADGYTIGFVNTPPLMTIPIERTAQFGGPQRFELLGNVIDDPCNFAVHADSPFRNLKDLADYARANPGKVTVGSTGIGSDDHLVMLMFERAAGVKMTHVPFKGSSDVRTALLSKSITLAAMNIGESLQSIKGGAPCATSASSARRAPTSRRICRRRASRATTSSSRRCAAWPRPRACRPRSATAGEGGRRGRRGSGIPGAGGEVLRPAALPLARGVRPRDQGSRSRLPAALERAAVGRKVALRTLSA